MSMRTIMAYVAILAGVLIWFWPTHSSYDGKIHFIVIPNMFWGIGLIFAGIFLRVRDYMPRTTSVFLLFSIVALQIFGRSFDFKTDTPTSNLGVGVAVVLAIAGIASLFIRDMRPDRSTESGSR